jgi:hypothetical protein
MAVFTEWTVLPHDPVVKHSDRVWTVTGTMPDGRTRRTMTMARKEDGEVVIHNAIALDDQEMLELEAWGTPTVILVPNGFHRQDAKIWQARFREAKVYCPEKAAGRVSQVVKLTGTYADLEKDDCVSLDYIPGTKNREATMTVLDTSGRTVVFADTICNVAPMKGVFGYFLGPTGQVSVPRVSRFLVVADKAAFMKRLDELANTSDLARVVPGHGRVITDNAQAAMKRAIASW